MAAAGVLCGLATVVAPTAAVVVAAPASTTNTTAVARGADDPPDPVGWCWKTRACNDDRWE